MTALGRSGGPGWVAGRAPRPLELIAGGVFAAVTAARRRRSLHPLGAAYAAGVTMDAEGLGAERGLTAPLEPGARRTASVRLSRGVGLPAPLPDVLGVAVKLHDADGRGGEQDLLFASSASGPLLHHLLVPVRGFAAHTYSTSLPYRAGERLLVLGVRSGDDAGSDEAEAEGWRFELLAAPILGRWRRVGELVLGAPLPRGESERLRFNPWNATSGLRPAGRLNALRDSAYRASQSTRPPAAT